jgi:hypothetical protein
MIPKSSSKATNPTTDDTMAKENGQTLIYKPYANKLKIDRQEPSRNRREPRVFAMVKQYLHH